MFTVIITEKGGDQRRMEFDKPEVTIGRVQGNDIILPKGNVSKRHSRIVLKDGKFIIVDLKSTNGTYVNGRKITSPLVIKDSDKIYIGDFILNVEEAGAGAGMGSHPPAPEPQDQRRGPPMPPMASAPPMPAALPEPERLSASPPMPHAPPPPPPRKTAPPPAPLPVRRPPPVADVNDAEDLAADDDMEEADAPPAADVRTTMPRPAVNPPPGLASMPPSPSPVSAPPRPAPPPARDPLAARAAAVGARDTGGRPAVPAPIDSPPTGPIGRDLASVNGPMGPSGTAPARPSAPRLVGAGAPPATAAPLAPPSAPPMPAPQVIGEAPRGVSAPLAAMPQSAPLPQPSAPVAAPPDPKRVRSLELQREIHDRLIVQLDLARVPVERLGEESLWQRAESAICDLVEQMDADGHIPQFVDQDALIKDALNETLGLGPLEDLLADETVTEVLVNRPDRVLVERNGRLEASDKAFSSDVALRQVIERLVAPNGRKIDESAPLIDIRLRDGARLTAAVPPLAVRGACLTLRKPRRASPSLTDLVGAGVLSANMADFLGICVSARRNIVVSGGAGAGKTTLLAAIAGLVPQGERIVSVEDVAELALARDNWIALESRPAEGGKPAVSVADVLRAAIRMRPQRLIVGEAAGAETFPLVSAMASANDGTLVSVVADGAKDALARLESLARLSWPDGAARGVRELVAGAAHIVVHEARFGDGVRRVSSIAEVTGIEGEGYAVRELFHFHAQGHGEGGVIRGRFAGAGVTPRFYEHLEARGIAADPAIFK